MKKSTIASIVIAGWGIVAIVIGAINIVWTLYTCMPGWIIACLIAYFLCRQEEKEEGGG